MQWSLGLPLPGWSIFTKADMKDQGSGGNRALQTRQLPEQSISEHPNPVDVNTWQSGPKSSKRCPDNALPPRPHIFGANAMAGVGSVPSHPPFRQPSCRTTTRWSKALLHLLSTASRNKGI